MRTSKLSHAAWALPLLLAAAGASWSQERDAGARATDGPRVRSATMYASTTVAASDSNRARRRVRVLHRVEQMLAQGRLQEAIDFLETSLKDDGYDREISRRLSRLYREARQWSQLEAHLVRQMERRGGEPEVSELRLLAEARFEQNKDDAAIEALMQLIALDPQEASYTRLVAGTLSRHGHGSKAVEVLLEGRRRMNDPYLHAQQLGTIYAEINQPVDAAREYIHVIVESPLNVSLMRAQIMELAASPSVVRSLLIEAEGIVRDHPEIPQLRLVLAELRQRNGDADGAWEVLAPLIDDPEMLQDLLQMAMAGLSDARLPNINAAVALNSLRLSQRVLAGLLASAHLPRGIQPRVYDTLNRTYLAMMSNDQFGQLDETEQARILEGARDTLLAMGERFPESQHTTVSLLRLAELYVDTLHLPEQAIPIYQRLQLNPNIGLEELQMAKVGLGRAYVAAGDTSSARTLFSTMGRDMEFVEGQGRAHYELGKLDFMGGEFNTAKERLASVAYEAPTAPYTNDALDLALLLAEELDGFNDADGLAAYGRALYFRATADDEALQAELRTITGRPSSGLRARARLDLARLFAARGDAGMAMGELDQLVAENPENKLVPPALELRGDLLLQQGNVNGAVAAYETVLLNHESYIFLDEVRDKVRALRDGPTGEKGELP